MENDEESDLELPDFESNQGPVFHRGTTWIQGIRITPSDCPDCLQHDEFDCDECTFFIPDDCRLLHNPQMCTELRRHLDVARDRLRKERNRRVALQKAILHELQTHGRPLHYTIVAQILVERHAHLSPRPLQILRVLQTSSTLFECVSEGTYKSR